MRFIRNQTWNELSWTTLTSLRHSMRQVQFFHPPVFALTARKKPGPKHTLGFVKNTGSMQMSRVTPSLSAVMLAVGYNRFNSSFPLCLIRGGGFSIYDYVWPSEFSFQRHSLYPSSFGWHIEQRYFFSIHQFIIKIDLLMKRKLIHNLNVYLWWFLIKFT